MHRIYKSYSDFLSDSTRYSPCKIYPTRKIYPTCKIYIPCKIYRAWIYCSARKFFAQGGRVGGLLYYLVDYQARLFKKTKISESVLRRATIFQKNENLEILRRKRSNFFTMGHKGPHFTLPETL